MLSPRQAGDVLQGLESGLETILQAHATGVPVEKCLDLYRGLGLYCALLRSHFEGGKKVPAPAAGPTLKSKKTRYA
jgi:hypothetical protein